MRDPLHRLYKTKLTLLSVILTVLGVALLVIARWAVDGPAGQWIADLPTADVGSALFTTGLIAITLTYIDQRDADERASQRLRKVLADEAPAIRDAVVDGFAFSPEALTSVASPQTLDRIVENCLAIRLRDRTLAGELYADLRQQLLRAPDRHYDMHVSVSLTRWSDGPASGPGAMFVATVRREYRVKAGTAVMRFACVSDLDEYRELVRDPSTTEVWYFEPVAGLDASSKKAFELLSFTLDGEPQPLRHSRRTGSQTFTVNATAESPRNHTTDVHVSYTYRVLVQQHGHLLYLDFGRPCKGLTAELWYGNCGIAYVNQLDFITGAQATRVSRSPEEAGTPSIAVSYDGWVLPKSGLAFVWVLESELGR